MSGEPLTQDELQRWGGKFVNSATKEIIEKPKGDVLVCGGAWPGHVGDRRCTCFFCGGHVALSAVGWELHRERPDGNVIACPGCREDLWSMAQHCTTEGVVGDISSVGWKQVCELLILWRQNQKDHVVRHLSHMLAELAAKPEGPTQ